ncbi:MAG: ABC transporter ATP-binding protein [Anaerovoracaceae bacterium]
MSIIKTENLTKYYNSSRALDKVNLEIEKGKIVGLAGPNGSGKTTIFKIICGLLTKYQGRVFIDGEPIGPESKKKIAYLPDRTMFGDWMKAKDAMEMFQDFFPDFDYMKAKNMLQSLKLDENQRLKTMSKGMLEKFQLALVMSRKAELYILDEPLAAVDPATRDYILETILNNYNTEGTILISTHLIQDVEKVFDEVIFINEGKIDLFGNVDDIRDKYGKSIDELFREKYRC